MKKVLLINPPESKQDGYFNPPVALLYLAGSLRQAGAEVAVLDGCLEGWQGIALKIRAFKPDIIGVTCLTPERRAAIRVASLAKEIDANVLTVMGGAHPTTMDRQLLTCYPYVDVAARGEGEEIIVELARDLPLAEIAGISWRKNGKVLRNHWRDTIADLNSIPLPAWDLIDLHRYPARGTGVVNGVDLAKAPRVSVVFSRGCVARCHFCSTWWIWQGWRGRSGANMADELSLLYHDCGVRHFCFADDTMTVNRDEVIKLCHEITTRDLKIAFHLTTRVDCVDEEMLARLKEAGCYEIAYGIETGCERLLSAMGKNVTLESADRAIALTKAVGIRATALIILGNVGETVETINETVAWLTRVQPNSVGTVGALWILPGTKLCARAKKLGLLDDEFWLSDEPYLVYDYEHNRKRLKLFHTSLVLRKALLQPLWFNALRFAFIRLIRLLKDMVYRLGRLLRRRG